MENTERPEMLAILAERVMDNLVVETELQQTVSGRLFENLPLAGCLVLRREIFTDGTKGNIEMSYPVTSAWGLGGQAWYEKVSTTPEGRVRHVQSPNHSEGQPLNGFRRAVLTLKLLRGKADHWEREIDFYGTVEEYED